MKLNPFARTDTGEHPQLRAFHQLYALYEGLPDRVLADPENRRAVAALEQIRAQAEEKLAVTGPAGIAFISAELQRMEALLVRLLPPEDLVPRLDIYRDEFHNLCTEENFAAYRASSGYKNSIKALDDPTLIRYLRSDALYLLSQLQRYNSLHQRAETSRTELLGHLARYTLAAVAVLLFPVLVFMGDRLDGSHREFFFVQVTEDASRHIAGIALISFCAVAGVTGAFLSATNRIQRLSVSRELARNAVVLKNTAVQLRWVPVTGMVSACVFAMLVWGGLLQGDLFPGSVTDGSSAAVGALGGAKVASLPLSAMLFSSNFAKLMVWCFLAGFSERLVPDMLDRVIPKGQQPAAPGATPGTQPGQDEAARAPVVDTTSLRAVVAPVAPPAPAGRPAAPEAPSTAPVESDVVEEVPVSEESMPGDQTGTNDTPDPDIPTADIDMGLVEGPVEQPDATKAEQPG